MAKDKKSCSVSLCVNMCESDILLLFLCHIDLQGVRSEEHTGLTMTSVAKCPNSSNRSVLLVSNEMVFSWRETKLVFLYLVAMSVGFQNWLRTFDQTGKTIEQIVNTISDCLLAIHMTKMFTCYSHDKNDSRRYATINSKKVDIIELLNACREHDWLPYWPSRGWQVSHQRWIWGPRTLCVTKFTVPYARTLLIFRVS